MSYPTLEQYNEAFQQPLHTILNDSELKAGSIATTGLGLPLALCGGFALTYTLKTQQSKFAVRCFHKQSNALEQRYQSITRKLKNLKSTYFVDFEFQPIGVRVQGKSFPIVKMAWAQGTTLGQFIEANYKNTSQIVNLISSLRSLSIYLDSNNIAHGDISPDNVMVSDMGRKIQLIDYDGMFVEDIKNLGSSELGNRNFQHPRRGSSNFDKSLDRFSFIGLGLALQIIKESPDFWVKTQSDANAFIFRANDFSDPESSNLFNDLFKNIKLVSSVKNFAAICKGSFNQIPTFDDFLENKNIPQIIVSVIQKKPSTPTQYLSAFSVLDANDYDLCLKHVGDKVELIGKIVEVKEDKTRHGKPYIFINFGPWKGSIVKVSIWSEGIDELKSKPDTSWVGRWISVVGLMEPPYVNRRFKYSHLAISITQSNQLHVITQKEAQFRLAGSSTRAISSDSMKNKEILASMKGEIPNQIVRSAPNSRLHVSTQSQNQVILNGIKGKQKVSSSRVSSNQRISIPKTSQPQNNSNCFIASEIYGFNAAETNFLRKWRDDNLTNSFGKLLVDLYYKISPKFIPILRENRFIRTFVKNTLDIIVKILSR